MNKRIWIKIGIAVAVLAALIGGVFTLAPTITAQAGETIEKINRRGFPPFPPRKFLTQDEDGFFSEWVDKLAEKLGITTDELEAAMEEVHENTPAMGEDGDFEFPHFDRGQFLGDGFPHGRGVAAGSQDGLLAEALGITTEEFEAAYKAVHAAALEQYKAEGGNKKDRFGLFNDEFQNNIDALLAEELEIDLAVLKAAQDNAYVTGIEAAVADETLTQEQASMMLAQHALRNLVDPLEMSAAALGMTPEAVKTAYQDGQRQSDLMEAAGLTQQEFNEAVQAAYEAVVQEAEKDGLITAGQAEQILSNGPRWIPNPLFGKKFFMHPGGMRGDWDGKDFLDGHRFQTPKDLDENH